MIYVQCQSSVPAQDAVCPLFRKVEVRWRMFEPGVQQLVLLLSVFVSPDATPVL